MDSIERQRLAFELFDELCNLPPDRQTAEIDRRCGHDPDLRAEVARLLGSDATVATNLDEAKIDNFLGRQMDDLGVADDASPETGGSYRILRVIGEGGMGTVYEAEQVNPRRRVAIKVIRGGRRSQQVIRRFEYEAQILARLEHPGIARLYEADTKIEGRQIQAFLAMELVRGLPIDEFVARRSLDIPARLRLFLKVCDAIEHAHRMGVIHRDLKPANILVTEDGQPKLLDFGVAQTFGEDKLVTTLTQHGQIVGTLPYMSPEQVDGRSAIDTRSDVYALGVVLYKMLTGVLPIDMTDASLATATHKLLNETPRRLGEHDRRLRGDLELIIGHALEKAREARYAAVADFAADIDRFLTGRPISVRGESRIYVLRKSLWRHRRSVFAAGLLLAALLTFGVVSSIQAQRNKQLADNAEEARKNAQLQANELRKLLYFSNIGFAQAAIEVNDSPRARMQLDACPPELRNWEWDYLSGQVDMSQAQVRLFGPTPHAVVLSGDARFVGSAVFPNTVNIASVENGSRLRIHSLPDGLPQVGFSNDGKLYCIASTSDELLCFEAENGEQKWKFTKSGPPPSNCRVILFARDAPCVLFVAQKLVRVIDAEKGELLREFAVDADYIQAAAISPDGAFVYTVDGVGKVLAWEVATGRIVRPFGDDSMRGNSIAVSRDGSRIAVKCYVGPLIVWDAATGDTLRRWDGLLLGVGFLTFGANRDHIYGSCSDYTIRRWNVADDLAPLILRGNRDWTHGMAVSKDGNVFHSAALDQTIRKWELNAPRLTRWFGSGHGQALGFVALPDGKNILCGGDDGAIAIRSLRDYSIVKTFAAHTAAIRSLAVTPDGRRFASADAQGLLKLWDIENPSPVHSLRGGDGEIFALSIFYNAKRIACADSKGVARMFDAENGEELSSIKASSKLIRGIAVHPSGEWLLTCGDDGFVRRWNLASRMLEAERKIDDELVAAVAFNPDVTLVAAGTARGDVLLLDPLTLRTIRTLPGHRQWVNCVQFMPDGQRLLTAGDDRVVRIWDVQSGAEILGLREAGYGIVRMILTPDASEFGVATSDGRVIFWRNRLQPTKSARR